MMEPKRLIVFVPVLATLIYVCLGTAGNTMCPDQPQTGDGPVGVHVVEGNTVRDWPSWIGRICVPESPANVVAFLLDDARTCSWRPRCQHFCESNDALQPLAEASCNDSPFTRSDIRTFMLFRKAFFWDFWSLTDRRVTLLSNPPGYRIEYSSRPNPLAKLHGAKVISQSKAIFWITPACLPRLDTSGNPLYTQAHVELCPFGPH